MRIIALEASTSRASVAFLDGESEEAVRPADSTGRLAEVFIPALDDLSARTWDAKDADLIVTGRGPGSFTGLRVAMAAAKGLAFATGVPVVAASSLMALASQTGERGTVVAALDARGGSYYYAVYDCRDGFPEEVETPALCGEVDLSAINGDVFVGPVRPEGWAGGPWLEIWPDAAALGRVGAVLYERRGADELAALRPEYLKRGQV
ncbi:MAG: tRNA (adenosine(37)-N6)-threonylcarbamoyltransferase complex dimerization subunit type 1 TsaB [Candidatus Zixiibacteriota bacterium]